MLEKILLSGEFIMFSAMFTAWIWIDWLPKGHLKKFFKGNDE